MRRHELQPWWKFDPTHWYSIFFLGASAPTAMHIATGWALWKKARNNVCFEGKGVDHLLRWFAWSVLPYLIGQVYRNQAMLLSWSKGRKLWRWLLFTTISKNTWKEDWRFRRAWWTEVKREMWILVGLVQPVCGSCPFGHVTSSRSVMLKVCIICHRLVQAKIILSCVFFFENAGELLFIVLKMPLVLRMLGPGWSDALVCFWKVSVSWSKLWTLL